MSANGEERELKLQPVDADLLERLANISSLGPFTVAGRRREKQVNSFFDTKTNALRRAHIGFRRRVIDRRPNATWTIKGPGTHAAGVSSRPEIEVELSRLMAPALVLGTLRQAARERGAPVLAELVADALSDGSLPQSRPYLEMETERWVLDLENEQAGWRAELALDTVGIIGRPQYEDIEIEVELLSGRRLGAGGGARGDRGHWRGARVERVEAEPGARLHRTQRDVESLNQFVQLARQAETAPEAALDQLREGVQDSLLALGGATVALSGGPVDFVVGEAHGVEQELQLGLLEGQRRARAMRCAASGRLSRGPGRCAACRSGDCARARRRGRARRL